MRRAAALILGGGPAGSATAIALARAGERPLLIERTREAGDALCGGFLSWRTLEMLETLGLSIGDLGGHAIYRLRIFAGTASGEAFLPGRAIGVSRHRLDSALLNRAAEMGAAIERGLMARNAEPGRVALSDGGVIECDSLFLATGKHDCRGFARPKVADDPALGLRLRIPASAPLARLVGSAIELHLFRGGYAGLVLQEAGQGNLCMAVQKSRLAEAGGDPRQLLSVLAAESPQLGERLALADADAAIDAVAAVPYGWRATEGVAGVFRLGDQAAVIPSLAGEGVGIALASGVMAARHWLANGPGAAPAFQTRLAARTRMPVGLASAIAGAAAQGWGRAAMPGLLNLFPGFAPMLARLTRIAP